MKQDRKAQQPADLERVIARNRAFLESAATDLRQTLLAADTAQEVPAPVVSEALQLYRDLRARILEIDAVNRLLAQRSGREAPKDPKRERLLQELDRQIRVLCARLEKQGAEPAAACAKATEQIDRTVRPPAERWLKDGDDTVAFTAKARLLDELEHPPAAAPGRKDTADARQTDRAGRGFTLFSIRGAATAIDALFPEIRLREHDIVERYSAYEIRGVLTHLRRTTLAEVSTVFQRLLTTRFPEVKCILIELGSPDHLNEEVLDMLERTAGGMRPGAMQIIDLTT